MHAHRRGSARALIAVGGTGSAVLLSLTATIAQAAPTPAPAISCAPSPGVTSSAITVGYLSPRTGAASPNFAGGEEAARLRVAQENAKGGIYGRKLVLNGYDDQSTGAVQTTVANKAVQGDGVFGMMMASSPDSAMPYFKANNIPLVGFNQLALQSDRNTFGISGPTSPTIVSTAPLERLKQAGVTKLALIAHASPGSIAGQGNTNKALALSGTGITSPLLILDEPMGAHDATTTALRIKNAGADGAYENMFVDGGVSIAQALAQQGVKLKGNYIIGLMDPAVIAKTGNTLEGVIGSTYGTVPAGVPGRSAVRTYVNGMKAAGLNPYTAIAPVGYVEADLMIKGLKLAGKCPTRESFIDSLRKVDDYDGGGMLPAKTSFKPGVTPMGSPSRCAWYLVVQNGVPVPDKTATCGKLVDVSTNAVVS